MKDKEKKDVKKKSLKSIVTRKKKVIKKEPSIEKDHRINIENSNQKTATFSLIEVIVIIVITGLIVSVCSALIVFNNYDKFSNIKPSDNNQSDISDFIQSYNHILNSYVKDVNKGELIDAAIKGMYNYLNDAYSVYVDEDTTETLTERLEGRYEGVGIEISMNENNQIIITRIFSNTPAERAGLKSGDIIVSLDGEKYEGKTSSDLSTAIKGSNKTTFVIGYLRDGKESTVTVEREEVLIDSVSSKIYDKTGYIEIETFSATTAKQLEDKIKSFDDNIESLIIDVRNNSGGYLSAAYETAELLIEKGKVIYQLKDKDGNVSKKTSSREPIRTFKKVIVLTNESSASASEILACALKESANATLVGKVTFGKGTVQETERLASGAMVKYTTAYWLTPDGNSINEVGLLPDFDVNDNADTDEDEQLLKAIEVAK